MINVAKKSIIMMSYHHKVILFYYFVRDKKNLTYYVLVHRDIFLQILYACIFIQSYTQYVL